MGIGLDTAKSVSEKSNIPTLLAGGAADIILSFLSGVGEDEEKQKQRDADLRMAADRLGFSYADLKQQNDQFRLKLKQQVDQFVAENKLNKAELAEKVRSSKVGEGQSQQQISTAKSFGLSDRFSKLGAEQEQSQRTAKIASQFAGMKPQPAPKPYVYPGLNQQPMPGPNYAIKPTALDTTKGLGTAALTQPTTGV